jgi:TolB-like protein/DNA-binding winged helix-turn-helix (wHTH) protein/cytochrome c-type biogenesis protein CcmH/NrfG
MVRSEWTAVLHRRPFGNNRMDGWAMTGRDAGSAAQTEPKRLRLDRYVLDLRRGCLLLDGREIALRPKTFAVLQYLTENSGRLVAKEELFAAVWPNLAVTDDALVQSVGELRRALGDDGPRLIRTVPRRGYRLETAASVIAPADPAPTAGAPFPAALGGKPRSPMPAIRDHASTVFKTALTDWRKASVAALALVALLAAATVWAIRGGVGSGDRPARSAELGAKAAIAILPFLNQSDDPGRDYFADGVTQDIINALGRFSALTVMSWNAVLPYKGRPSSPGDIGRKLAVRYQVEGSVRHAADRVRVAAQLVDTDGRVLWSVRFDEALADLFTLQDKITIEIAGALAIRVTELEQRRVLAKPTESLEAYDLVLRARPAFQRPTRASNVEARALLRRAIQLDPNYAAAYAALAETYHIAVSWGWAESPTVFLSRAEEMASKALSLNDAELRARIVLGRIHIFYHRYEQAKAEMDRVIAINPSDAHGLAGRGNILLWLGQTDAAIEALELAQRIDPELNAVDRFALSLAYYLKRRYDAAIGQAELAIRKTEGAHFSHVVLAAAYAERDRPEDAARVAAMVRRIDPTFDAEAFGNKLLKAADLEHLRHGLRKAGLYGPSSGPMPPSK